MTDQATQDAPTLPDHRPAVAGQVERSVSRQPPDLGRRLGSLETLPPELRAMLSKKMGSGGGLRKGGMPAATLEALKRLHGIATTDELIVEVYRETGHVPPTKHLFVNRLTAMRRAGHIELDKKRKAWRLPR